MLRNQVGLSQEGTAQRAGLHKTQISLLERGLRSPRLDTIVKLGGAVEAEALRATGGHVLAARVSLEQPGVYAPASQRGSRSNLGERLMELEFAERFGRNLWRCRRQSGMSQAELARLIDLHPVEISLLERGQRLPRLDTILKVAAGVEASPCVLLAGLRWQPGYTIEGRFWIDDGPHATSRPAESNVSSSAGLRPPSDELRARLG